jgi:hypothetical protein
LRDKLLNETLFRSLSHTRAVLNAWRAGYNNERFIRGPVSHLCRSTAVRRAALHLPGRLQSFWRMTSCNIALSRDTLNLGGIPRQAERGLIS